MIFFAKFDARPTNQLLLVGQLFLTMHSIGMRFTQLLLVRKLSLDGSSKSVSLRAAPLRWQLCLAMRSIGMRYRQLLLVGLLSLDRSSERSAQGTITNLPAVLSYQKTDIFPDLEEKLMKVAGQEAMVVTIRRLTLFAVLTQALLVHRYSYVRF